MSLRFCFKMNFFVATRSYCMSEEEGDHVEVRGAQSMHCISCLSAFIIILATSRL